MATMTHLARDAWIERHVHFGAVNARGDASRKRCVDCNYLKGLPIGTLSGTHLVRDAQYGELKNKSNKKSRAP